MRDPASPRPRPRPRPTLAAAACAFLLAWPAAAGAEISDTHPIDGPSAEMVEATDAAMAEDGSGGVVYLKKVGGRNHVFAARFDGGAWSAPQRIDTGQEFDSSWPRIAAGDKGRLLVTWVQEFGAGTDRMFSANLDPGASGFEPPVPVDFNVGEATSTFPDLAMNAGGQAYLAYTVVTDISPSNPPGYVGASVRVARYNNRLWSMFGSPVNRNPATPVRLPTEASGPRIGIDVQGNGVVAWQEPDDEFVDRVWARRLFGTTVGVPLQVSPSTWEGAPLRGARRRLRARCRRLWPGRGRLPPAAGPVEQAQRPAPLRQRDARRLRQRGLHLQGGEARRRRQPGRVGSAERRGRTQWHLRRRLRRRRRDRPRRRRPGRR